MQFEKRKKRTFLQRLIMNISITHICVSNRQGQDEGESPDDQKSHPAVCQGAECPGPHGVDNHNISKQREC